jgi:hypothetical protein
MYFDCDNVVTLLDVDVWGKKNYLFQKIPCNTSQSTMFVKEIMKDS